MFLGRGYIISIRHGASASYARVRECAEAAPQRLAHGEDYVLYAIVDFIVDNYLAVVGPLAEEVEALEERILTPPLDEAKIARIYELRRELQKLRLVVAPTAEVCRRLAHLELPGIDPAFRPYFRDIVDHVNRVLEQIDTLREMLGFAFEASLLLESSSAEHDRPAARRLGCDPSRADCDRRHLRHELREHAGAPVALWLLRRACDHRRVCTYLFVRFRRAGWI